MSKDVETRLGALEARNRRLAWQTRAQFAVLAVAVAALVGGFSTRTPERLTLSELEIVDAQGEVRVRIGADLPDAVTNGRRIVRGQQAAGVMLYDAAGHERGGYVTMEPSGNILLTLDDRDSAQKALFVAGPDGGAALQVWEGDALAELRADGSGARLSVTADGRVVQQTPVVRMGAEPCAAYRGALATLSRADVDAACNARFAAEACAACLDE